MKDKFIRDVTSVTPLSKSEVRRRLDEVIKEELNRITNEIIGEKDLLEIRQNSEPDSWNTLKGENIN